MIGVRLKWRGSNQIRADIMQNTVYGESAKIIAGKLQAEIPADDNDGSWNTLMTTNKS